MQDPDLKCRHFGILWYFGIFAKKSNMKSNPLFPILSDFFSDFQTFPDVQTFDSTTLNQTLSFKTTLFGKYIPIIFIPLKRRKYFMPCPFETIISSKNKDKGEIFFNISFLKEVDTQCIVGERYQNTKRHSFSFSLECYREGTA